MPFQGHRCIAKSDGSTSGDWFGFVCGHCHAEVSGAVIAYCSADPDGLTRWLLCPKCNKGSVVDRLGKIYPGTLFGPSLIGLPSRVNEAYEQARRSMSVSAFTGCELICRKILMHVAVEKGAKEGESFAGYLAFLEQRGYVTPPMKPWVEVIRRHGNQATHELDEPNQERAESTLMFTAELLRLIYEMEHMAKKYAPDTTLAEPSTTRSEQLVR